MDRRAQLAVMFAIMVIVACGAAPPPEEVSSVEAETSAEPAAEHAGVRHDVVYVCDCGPECTCNTVATSPGSCTCGKELVWAHVVKVDGDEALLCTCDEGCSCAIDPADESKCGCGAPIRRMSLKGTGLYFCNCGGSCTCNHISAEPGNCGCGMELTTST